MRVRDLVTLILVLAAMLATAPATAAQSRARSKADAIADYEQVKALPDAQRVAAVNALSRYDDPDVALLLIDEAARALAPELRRAVAVGLGRQRGNVEVVPPLVKLLDDAQSDWSLRNAAADALGQHGDAGVAALLQRFADLRGKSADATTRPLRQAILRGLARSDAEAGLAAVAGEVTGGEPAERLLAMTELRRARPTPAVVSAREAAAEDSHLPLAVEAVRQLAETGHAKAKPAALKLAPKLSAPIVVTARVAWLDALRHLLAPDVYALYLDAAAFPAGVVEDLVRDQAPKLAEDAAFTNWLVAKGLTAKAPLQRVVAVRILATAKLPAATPAIAALLNDSDRGVVTATIRVLGARGDAAAVAPLRKLLRHRDHEYRCEALLALHALLRDDPEWRKDLIAAARGRELGPRLTAIDLLAELQDDEAVTFATRGVDDRNWSVRAAAYAVLARVRRVDSIPLLIGRLGRETGRLREDALDALEALTRMRFHETARWEQWWAESRISFEMPPAPETAKDAPRTRRAAPTTVSYYDLPMTSTRAVFVVDTSGSMSAPIGTGGTTRLEESKRQLRRVLDSIPDTFMVNIVPFGSTANPFAAVLQKATKAVKADFTERIVALTPAGGTNLHAGLTTAFADDTIDTVYVLSDGSPSAGEITDPTELADEVQRWNRTRRVKIHCIAVGQDSPFLRRLATDSGGEYTHVR